MLTKEYMDKNFITAHFCDNERTQIEIITKTPDGKGINPTIVPYDTSNAWCKLLFEYVDLDTLHENTWNKIQDDRDAFKKVVWDIAKQDGILQEVGKKNAEDVFGIINDFIFKFDDTKKQVYSISLTQFDKIVFDCFVGSVESFQDPLTNLKVDDTWQVIDWR